MASRENSNEVQREDIDKSVRLYRCIAGAFDRMWQATNLRTKSASWRRDGVGSCHYVYDDSFGLVILNYPKLIRARLEELADQRSWEVPGQSNITCPFHRRNKGCILGDLKSPLCLDFFDDGQEEEIKENFGITIPPSKDILEIAGLAGTLIYMGIKLDPAFIRSVIRGTLKEVRQVTAYIETFPILSNNHPYD